MAGFLKDDQVSRMLSQLILEQEQVDNKFSFYILLFDMELLLKSQMDKNQE